MNRVSAERRALAIGLYSNGFKYSEVAHETGYSVATIKQIIKSAIAGGEVSNADERERLEQGLRNFVQYVREERTF